MKIINLLPKSKQRDFRYEKIFHSVLRLTYLAAASFVLVFLTLFGTRFYVTHQGSQIDAKADAIKNFADKQENTVLRNKIKGINNVFTDFQSLSDTTPHWSKVLAAFTRLVPSDVKIQTFTADAKKKQVSIIGYSPTRESVIALYNNISRDDKNFFNVDYPLENVSKPTDVSFHYNFSIRDELLK